LQLKNNTVDKSELEKSASVKSLLEKLTSLNFESIKLIFFNVILLKSHTLRMELINLNDTKSFSHLEKSSPVILQLSNITFYNCDFIFYIHIQLVYIWNVYIKSESTTYFFILKIRYLLA